MNRKTKWIIGLLVFVSVMSFIIWQIYSLISSDENIVISDQVNGKETITLTSPGEPLKNASKELKKEIDNRTT